MWQAKHPSSALENQRLDASPFQKIGISTVSTAQPASALQCVGDMKVHGAKPCQGTSMFDVFFKDCVDRRESPNVQYNRIQKADLEDLFKKDQKRGPSNSSLTSKLLS